MSATEHNEPHRLVWYEKSLCWFTAIKPGEGKSCLLLSMKAAMLMACYYLLKVIREPLILSQGGAELKSYATALQAALLIVIVPLFTWVYHHYAKSENAAAIINRVLLFFIVNLLIFNLLYVLDIKIAFAFYVWLGIFGVMVLAQFWAFAADLYNVRSGQRLFVIIAVGAALGAWLGSAAAGPLLPSFGVEGIMLVATILLALTLLTTELSVRCIPISSNCAEENKNEASHPPKKGKAFWLEGFTLVATDKYLRLIALFVVILNMINSTGEYILAKFVIAESELQATTALGISVDTWQGQFYSSYFAWITLASFILQLLVVSRLFKWIGIKGAIVVLPVVMLIGYSFMFIFPIFALIRLAMISENSINYSVQNTTRQALFLPVPRKIKYIGKTTIETFFYRLGDLFYGLSVFVGAQLLSLDVTQFIAGNIILASLLLLLAWRIGFFHQLQVQKTLGNSPPFMASALPGLSIPSGSLTEFTISEHTFQDPDLGDALSFSIDGQDHPLPAWIRFDAYSRTFYFRPPAHSQGTINITITAADYEGLTVSSPLKVRYGDE